LSNLLVNLPIKSVVWLILSTVKVVLVLPEPENDATTWQYVMQTGAFRYLFNEGMYHGSKVTEDYWHFLNPGDMVKNKDGHWQMRDNAASYAAGLGGSTATHSCTNSGITYCQVVASFSGSGNTNTTLTVDKINQTTDLIGKPRLRIYHRQSSRWCHQQPHL
jgi:hypothetical protein